MESHDLGEAWSPQVVAGTCVKLLGSGHDALDLRGALVNQDEHHVAQDVTQDEDHVSQDEDHATQGGLACEDELHAHENSLE